MFSTASAVLIETRNTQARCGACRYFVYDRCSNTSARVEGEDVKIGECPHFRFLQGNRFGSFGS